MLLWVIVAISVLQWADVHGGPTLKSCLVTSSFSGYLRNASKSASISVTQVLQHALVLHTGPEPKRERYGSAEERAYHALLAATGKEDSSANNESFTEALDEIQQAVYTACFIEGITEADLPNVLEDLEAAYRKREIHDLRKAYGSILCLKSKASRKRRRSIDEVYDDISANFVGTLFFPATYSVGFAIDDTSSMGHEIEAVKCLVRAFIKGFRNGPAQYILGTFNDPDNSASTTFFTPEVYDSNSISEVQKLLSDLDSIRVRGGGDTPEYGMNGILRVFDASTVSDPFAPNHIFLFTDAPPKDHSRRIEVETKLEPPTACADDSPHTSLNGFLASNLVRPCGSLTVEQCYSRTGRAYVDLITSSCGILVPSLTEGSFADFISEYNSRYGFTLPGGSCRADGSRRKRSAPHESVFIPSVRVPESPTSVVRHCMYKTVSELAKKLTLLVTPQGDSVTFTVTVPFAKVAGLRRSATVTQVVGYDDPRPGRYTVCANEAFELDARIDNYFPFSVEFFNLTSGTPYLLTLPPPGCPVNVTLFSPDINKLSSGTHHLEFVSTAGNVISRVPLVNRGCSSRYIQGSRSVNLPHEDFNVRFSGVSKGGYSFEASLLRRYTPPLPPLQLRPTTAPTQIDRGETAVYSFHLTTTKTYPGCNLRLPISIKAHTDMVGVTLSSVTGGIFSGSYTFNVRVTVSRDAPIGNGLMVLRVSNSQDKILLESTARIGVGAPDCPCQNGGTCQTRRFFGRVVTVCNCPYQYIGHHCQSRRPEPKP